MVGEDEGELGNRRGSCPPAVPIFIVLSKMRAKCCAERTDLSILGV